MSEKNLKLLSPDGKPLDDPSLSADFETAEKIGPFRVGQTAFFYRDGFQKHAIPFADIERAFTRIEPVPTHCCCGRMDIEIYRLIIVSEGREIANIRTEDEKLVDKAQALLKERVPGIKIGYKSPE